LLNQFRPALNDLATYEAVTNEADSFGADSEAARSPT